MVFAITIYGEKHFGMLLTNIFSITKSNIEVKIFVFWQDINNHFISILSQAFPEVELVNADFNFTDDPIKRISSKTVMWEFVAKYIFNRNEEFLCLVDTDVFVIKDIRKYFSSSFDIIFTHKDEIWPLNSGVLLVKNTKKTLAFFENWKDVTFSILNCEAELKYATSRKYPYGGADQMALYKILQYQKGKNEYKVKIKEHIITFLGMPCCELNETNSTRITKNTHIIHYKGGWQPILLKGNTFTKNRPKKDSWEMYILYLETHINAVNHINKYSNSDYSPADFGIKIPIYLEKNSLKEKKIYYFFHHIYKCILNKTNAIYSRFRK